MLVGTGSRFNTPNHRVLFVRYDGVDPTGSNVPADRPTMVSKLDAEGSDIHLKPNR